ncbi:hypothetical protein ACFVUW_04560 [Streptomyces xiamenensis]|uniref:hypothetical protein n=1 Tax=Streptomyces xiamenensis TaxID=408015 RepID=UPI0036E35C1B
MRFRTTGAAAAALLLLLTLPASPAFADGAGAGGGTGPDLRCAATRGALVEVTPLERYGRAELAAVLESATGVPAEAGLVRYGAAFHRLIYRTLAPHGGALTVSALLVLPALPTGAGATPLPTVSGVPGRTAQGHDAHSAGGDSSVADALLYAAGGFAVVASDGPRPGPHPSPYAVSARSAALDSLRAARTAAGRLEVRLSGELYVTGLPQGGQAATAVGRALRREAAAPYGWRATAPVAGPYDLRDGHLPALSHAHRDGLSEARFLTYLRVAQHRLRPPHGHHPGEGPRPPYTAHGERHAGGTHTVGWVRGHLPATDGEPPGRWYAPPGAPATGVDGECARGPGVLVRLHEAVGDRVCAPGAPSAPGANGACGAWRTWW